MKNLIESKKIYKPNSITLTLYDAQSNEYGITYNTELKPILPVIQVCEGTTFNENAAEEYAITSEGYTSFNTDDSVYDYFISKGVMSLDSGKTYTYRIYDKSAKVGSVTATFTTKNLNTDRFTFVHLSDSQVAGQSKTNPNNTGILLQRVLASINNSAAPDFLLHVGDVVEYPKYETYWEKMLNFNSNYLMSNPMMPISGNHETSYHFGGSNEIFKHFNLKIPTQSDTTQGFYYHFDYGNTRFIMLNTNRLDNSNKLTADQYDWLDFMLKNNNKLWTIVALHNPVFTSGAYSSNPAKNRISVALQSQLSSLFAENGVNLVLQGHNHLYNKTYPITAQNVVDISHAVRIVDNVKYDVNPNGTIYAMHGTTGNKLMNPFKTNNELYEWSEKSSSASYAEIEIDGNKLTVNVKCVSEDNITTTVKSYGIIKE